MTWTYLDAIVYFNICPTKLFDEIFTSKKDNFRGAIDPPLRACTRGPIAYESQIF